MFSLFASALLASVIINEVSDRGSLGTCTGADWIEIANTGSSSEDLTGWKICDSDGCTDEDAITLSGSIDAGAYQLVCGLDAHPRFIGADDVINLHDAGGTVVSTSGTLGGDGAFGKTWARSPDLSGSFAYSYLPTPGAANGELGSAPTFAIVVNEVSDKGTSTFTCAGSDWVELVNTNSSSLDLSGHKLCDERGCDETDMCAHRTCARILP
jgi:hypothetical protein